MTIHVARDLKLVPIESLNPYEKNARTHSDEQVEQIAASIRKFGFTNPILVDGEKGIIAGHGRLLAAKKIGMTDVPVVELSHLSPAEKRAYIIADNKLALNAGWDEALLAAEIAALRGDDFDVSVLGFTDDELAALEVDVEEVPPGGDEVPGPAAEAMVVAGDLFTLGRHRLVCGNATAASSWDLIQSSEPTMVFTSPPYGVGYGARLRDHYVPGADTAKSHYN